MYYCFKHEGNKLKFIEKNSVVDMNIFKSKTGSELLNYVVVRYSRSQKEKYDELILKRVVRVDLVTFDEMIDRVNEYLG